MKNWTFTIKLEISGYGDTPEEAWADAIEQMSDDFERIFNDTTMPPYERNEAGDYRDDDDGGGPDDEADDADG